MIANDGGADGVACDVDGGTNHIEDTVNTHNEGNAFYWVKTFQYATSGMCIEEFNRYQIKAIPHNSLAA